MQKIKFEDKKGNFVLDNAQTASEVYLPLMNEAGMISSVTPFLSGDSKTGQNSFLLEPAGEQTLQENRASRNFWIVTDGGEPWSACGQSALQASRRFTENERCIMRGGPLWQTVSRIQPGTGIKADILSFVPSDAVHAEIMQVSVENSSDQIRKIRCAAAIPVYGRSADNIRDHRHVTSLLNRVTMEPYGIRLRPTLTFDERGHQPGKVTYRVWAAGDRGESPSYAVPKLDDFIGSGSLDWPQAVVCGNYLQGRIKTGETAEGCEMIAALFFDEIGLRPGEKKSFQVVLAIDDSPAPYLTAESVQKALDRTRDFWDKKTAVCFMTADPEFDSWMHWVSIQPVMRRICGCSFLPHHDYGRGGRGWRDLWQDSLALLLNDPYSVRDSILGYFAGVRADGTNATIIGTGRGEFKADRNNIPRVWMDHGFWPMLTTALYFDETGDMSLLWENQNYFNDGFPIRGEQERPASSGMTYKGSVLEHLIVESVTAFFDIGEHGNIRLRGADWNDGLDMASDRGESVAFTAAYAWSLKKISEILKNETLRGKNEAELSIPLLDLMESDSSCYGDAAFMRTALLEYCRSAYRNSGKRVIRLKDLADKLTAMADWIRNHIRKEEWTGNHINQNWFNSYYDNNGKQTDGIHDGKIRMMLTGQVFTLFSGTATEEQAESVIRAADRYLFDPKRGGFCLNTDFHEVKTDLGRMFGFAYGTKENGAVFSHMSVMYSYALYSRGFVREGWKVLKNLYRQSISPESRILPGIPEYFDLRGRGMYPYLTGAASWYLIVLRTQIFGICGERGNLVLEPKLMAEQFDEKGEASICCRFKGMKLKVLYRNPQRLDWENCSLGNIEIDGQRLYCGAAKFRVPADYLVPDTGHPCRIIADMEEKASVIRDI